MLSCSPGLRLCIHVPQARVCFSTARRVVCTFWSSPVLVAPVVLFPSLSVCLPAVTRLAKKRGRQGHVIAPIACILECRNHKSVLGIFSAGTPRTYSG